MQKIIEGVCQFKQGEFDTKKQLFEQLAEGQQPLALFITCSDSRIDPNLLTQTQPGELFVIRNAGNIVPPFYGAARGGEAATIEYAVEALQVNDIIICGHSHCGAMGGLLHPEMVEQLTAVKDWLKHAEATVQTIKEKYGHLTDEGVEATARLVGMSPLEVEQLATFYTFIYREPVGKYVIHVCDSVVCWMNGYETIKEYLSEKLGIQDGETTRDGLFTLLPVCCVGYCDRSPAILINKKVYGNLTTERIDEIIQRLKNGS